MSSLVPLLPGKFRGNVRRQLRKHLHDLRVGAAMQAAGESAYACGHASVHVRLRRDHLSAGKGRGIERMVGMEHQRDVQVARRLRVGLLSRELPEKVSGMSKRVIGGERFEAVSDPVPGRNNPCDPRDETEGLCDARFARLHGQIRVSHRQERHRCLKHIHGPGLRRQPFQTFEDKTRQAPGIDETARELMKLPCRGQCVV